MARAPGITQWIPLPYGLFKEFLRDPLGYKLRAREQFGDVFRSRIGPSLAHFLYHPDHVRRMLYEHQKNYPRGWHYRLLDNKSDGYVATMDVADHVLYFKADDGIHGTELWRSDGTAGGTWLVAVLFPGPTGFLGGVTAKIGSMIYAAFNDGIHGRELWRSDGTAGGTTMVKDVLPGPLSGVGFNTDGSGAPQLSSIGSFLYMVGNDGTSGREPILSDGTEAGTVLVDLEPGSTSSLPFSAVKVIDALGNVRGAFFADQGGTKHYWVTDGTPPGTYQPVPTLTGAPNSPEVANGRAFFSTSVGGSNLQMWASDGTAVGTELISSTTFGTFGSGHGSTGRQYFFTRFTSGNYVELWVTNGTAAGTEMVQLNGWGTGSFNCGGFTDVNGITMFFGGGGFGSTYGMELWRIDGPPQISSTHINDGSPQRSRVTSLTVAFNSVVSFTGSVASAFSLMRSGGGSINYSAAASVINGVTVVTLDNFTGAETQFGSLVDGRYTLTALASQISANGQQLDGNGDGTPGDDYTFGDGQGLFRFYGDINGDRTVNGFDLGFFRNAFGTQTGDPNYLSYLDINGDGVINGFDLGQFRTRFGTMLP